MTPEEIKDRHYKRLNDYRNSLEYQQGKNCYGKREGVFPSLLGNRWEINEAIYWEFLEMMPPLGRRGGSFYMREFTFDDITTKFSRDGDRFFCEFARYPATKAA